MARPKGEDRGLFERPKGSGIWWIRYADAHGKEHREKVGPKSEARKRYIQRKDEIRRHKFDPHRIERRKLMTLEAAFEHYADEMKGENRTAHRFEQKAKFWLKDFEGFSLDDILPEYLQKWRRKMLSQPRNGPEGGKPLSVATVNRYLSFLRRLFTLACRDGKALNNPFTTVKLSKENNRRIRYLTENEEEVLHKNFPEEHWPIIEIAVGTGLRESELFGMERTHVDFEAKVITVPRSKNGQARHVPFNETVEAHLRAILASHNSRWVFVSKTGKTPINPNNFYNRVFLVALAKSKLTDVVFHTLRHTFASRLVMEGVDLYRVMALLGHSSIEMTKRYAHLAPDFGHESVAKLNKKKPKGKVQSKSKTISKKVAAESKDIQGSPKRSPRP